MRYNLQIILLIFLFNPLQGIDLDSVFQSANAYYQEGKYEEATASYLEIINSGYSSSELFYNLGNAYFRSNKTGKARLYYEKALLLSPQDPSIKANLDYIENFLPDKFEEVPVFFLRKWIINLRESLAPDNWAILSLIIFTVSFVLMVVFLFTKKISLKKNTFFSGISLFAISIICLIFAYSASENLRNSNSAVLTVPSTVVKSAPRDSGKDLFIIHEGTKVWLEESTGEWQEIKVSDGRIGWLPSVAVEKI